MAAKSKSKGKSRRKHAGTDSLVERRPHRCVGGGFLPDLMMSHAEHESPIERAMLLYLILCSDVDQIESQKPAVTYIGENGSEATYTPDFTVTRAGQRSTIENKALSNLVEEESMSKYTAIARRYMKAGEPFHFVVDAQLEEMPRAGNVRLLFRYATSPAPERVKTLATERLAAGPRRIRQLCGDGELQLVDVYTLIATKCLCIDWNTPLSIDSEVSLPGQPHGGLNLEHILRSTRFSGLLEELAVGRRPSDQRLLAHAKVWRQRVYSLTPFNFVGGLPGRLAPLDSSGDEPGPERDGWSGDHAVGVTDTIRDFAGEWRAK